MSGHIGELAELYALGSLDACDRAHVERHIRVCVECANRIREAEETIAFLSDLEEHHEPPQTIARNFAAKLAGSRAAQKLLSAKAVGTVLGTIAFTLGLAYAASHGQTSAHVATVGTVPAQQWRAR